MQLNEEENRVVRMFTELVNRRPTCLRCMHFNEQSEGCDLFENKRPPARVIAFGCQKYLDNNPPF